MLLQSSVAPCGICVARLCTAHLMNALISTLGILITAIALWGTIQNLSKDAHKHVRTAEAAAPAPGVAEDESIRIKGRVVDANGDPVAGVMVVVRPFADTLQHIVSVSTAARDDAFTDAAGQFELSEMIPGNYSVMALHGNHPPGIAKLVVSEAGSAKGTSVEIVLDRTDELLSA